MTYGFYSACSEPLLKSETCSDAVKHRLAVLGTRHTAVCSCATCSCSSLFFCRNSSTSFFRASASMLSGGPPWRCCFTKLVTRAQDKPIGLHCKHTNLVYPYWLLRSSLYNSGMAGGYLAIYAGHLWRIKMDAFETWWLSYRVSRPVRQKLVYSCYDYWCSCQGYSSASWGFSGSSYSPTSTAEQAKIRGNLRKNEAKYPVHQHIKCFPFSLKLKH